MSQSLIEHGAEIDVVDNSEMTPLHRAAMCNCIGVVQILIESGADLKISDGNGRTALQLAARRGYKDVAKLLIKYGGAWPHIAFREQDT